MLRSDNDGDDAMQLAEEISDLKEMLREISRKLTRIETKVKRRVTSRSLSTSESAEANLASENQKTTNLTSAEVLQVYEEIRQKAKAGKEEEVKQKLSTMNLADLNLLCWELGASMNSKNPSRKKMVDAILGRIKQSLMLSRHIDRQAP